MSLKSFGKKKLENIFSSQTKQIIQKYQPKIIAVAGSVGKTGTKYSIATVLAKKYRVQWQAGNYNTEISVPFILLGRDLPGAYDIFGWISAWLYGKRILKNGFHYDIVVVEIGTDYPGNILNFENYLRPTLSIVTAVSQEHMEFFDNLEAVAKEELSIANYSDKLLINTDDIAEEYLQKYLPKATEYRSYGFEQADYKATIIDATKPEIDFSILISNAQSIELSTASLAEHSLKPVVGAVAVADMLGLSVEEITAGVKELKPVPGRMQVLRGIKNSTIIDDSYNSSPIACKAALETVYSQDAPQKIAILGMMNELGDFSKSAHHEIGGYCDSTKLNLVITIGRDANKFLAESAEANGCRVIRCKSPYEAGLFVAEQLQDNAIVLVKGSQNGVFAEEAIKLILANPNDSSRLVRQSSVWLAKKQAQFRPESI